MRVDVEQGRVNEKGGYKRCSPRRSSGKDGVDGKKINRSLLLLVAVVLIVVRIFNALRISRESFIQFN